MMMGPVRDRQHVHIPNDLSGTCLQELGLDNSNNEISCRLIYHAHHPVAVFQPDVAHSLDRIVGVLAHDVWQCEALVHNSVYSQVDVLVFISR